MTPTEEYLKGEEAKLLRGVRIERCDGGIAWVRRDTVLRIEPAYPSGFGNVPTTDTCIVVLADKEWSYTEKAITSQRSFAAKGHPDAVAKLLGWA
jgi:hypothetical protein